MASEMVFVPARETTAKITAETTNESNTLRRINKGLAEYLGEGPKWRLEHATGGQATCQQAACKRAQIKFTKGELRPGTHTFFERESRWYMAWRHWGCATNYQIQGLKVVTDNDVTQAPGYDNLSPDAQEQVRLAFENDGFVDKNFKGIDAELAKVVKRYGGDIVNAEGYKVDIASTGRAGCRKSGCPWGTSKIAKGELRLGISVPFDGEHSSWQYKHWMCISEYDLKAIQQSYNEDCFDGVETLSDEYKTVVIEMLEKGEVMEPPKPAAPVIKPKKTKKSKKKAADDDSETDTPEPERKSKAKVKQEDEVARDYATQHALEEETEEINAEIKNEDVTDAVIAGPIDESVNTGVHAVDEADAEEHSKSKPKAKAKAKSKAKAKGRGKKRPSDDLDDESEEPEYVPRKTRSRALPMVGRVEHITQVRRLKADPAQKVSTASNFEGESQSGKPKMYTVMKDMSWYTDSIA